MASYTHNLRLVSSHELLLVLVCYLAIEKIYNKSLESYYVDRIASKRFDICIFRSILSNSSPSKNSFVTDRIPGIFLLIL